MSKILFEVSKFEPNHFLPKIRKNLLPFFAVLADDDSHKKFNKKVPMSINFFSLGRLFLFDYGIWFSFTNSQNFLTMVNDET